MPARPYRTVHGLLALAAIAASVSVEPSRAGEDAAATGITSATPGAVAGHKPATGAKAIIANAGARLILRLPADGADRARTRGTVQGTSDPADAPVQRETVPRDLALFFIEPEVPVAKPDGPTAFYLPANLPGPEQDQHRLPWHRAVAEIPGPILSLPPSDQDPDTTAEKPTTELDLAAAVPIGADPNPDALSSSAAGDQVLPPPQPTTGPVPPTGAWTERATISSASAPEDPVPADAAHEPLIAAEPPEEVAAPPPTIVSADPPASGPSTTLSGQDPIKLVTIPLGQSRRWTLDHHATAVFTATPEVADVRLLSPELLYVVGTGVGRTSVAVLDDDGLVDEWLVETVLDLEPVHAFLESDPAFGGVRVQRFARGVTLTGEVDSVGTAERVARLAAATLPETTILANEIRVTAPQQVNLEVQIAEVQRSVTESLGINWDAFSVGGELLWRIGRPLGFGALGELPPELVDGRPANMLAGRYSGSRGTVQGVVDALANAGLANVLARPNLTAISGETASFFSGGEYPLPVGFRDGMITFEYKKYGVLLDFVPTIVHADRITLTVRPEVSETSDNQSLVTAGIEIPVLNVRRAETTVEVGNGESIVIAGLFHSGSNKVESGVPGLRDVPVFGLLFRQEQTEARETELIVVVTANLVRPTTVQPDVALQSRETQQIRDYHF